MTEAGRRPHGEPVGDEQGSGTNKDGSAVGMNEGGAAAGDEQGSTRWIALLMR